MTCREECIITAYQNAYYYTDSFEEAKEKMRAFAETIQRPFGVRYNPYTQAVEVLSNAQKITALISELKGDISIVSSALRKISATDMELDVAKLTQMLAPSMQLASPMLDISDEAKTPVLASPVRSSDEEEQISPNAGEVINN